MLRRRRGPPLFPYTTLFRSCSSPSAPRSCCGSAGAIPSPAPTSSRCCAKPRTWARSEEHTSELQSRGHVVCRLLLEKKKYIDPESSLPAAAVRHSRATAHLG